MRFHLLPCLASLMLRLVVRLLLLLVQVYVDCTLGAGGHMEAMLQQHKVLVTKVVQPGMW